MPRPTLDEDTLDRLEEITDARAKVPASHLTTDQRVAFVLDELADADKRNKRLSQRVDNLEAEIEELRNEGQPSTQPGGGLNATGGVGKNKRF